MKTLTRFSALVSIAAMAIFSLGPSLTAVPTALAVDNVSGPSVPTNFTVTAISPTQINLSWTGSTIASTSTSTLAGYTIFRNGGQINNTASTTYSDMNLTPATTYNYFISAFDNLGGTSTQTSTLSATTFSNASSSTSTMPSIPTNLMASSTSSSSITLTWTASTNSNGSTSPITYVIYRGGAQTATTTAGVTNFIDTGLNAGTNYSYTIAAVDVNGSFSGQTASVNGMTMSSGGNGNGSTTPSSIGTVMGWLIIPLNVFNRLTNPGTGSTTPSSPYNYVNGYPMLNNNYVDCNGNIDNDPAHHTLNPSDHDPAHHSGMNCPGGIPAFGGNATQNNGQPWWLNGSSNGMFSPFMFLTPGSSMQWVVIPLTQQIIQQLNNMNWTQ